MRNQFRVTKYDPSFRDSNGAFLRDDWTSYSDIGRIYNGAPLSESEYLAVESAYLLTVEEFLREAGIETLELRGLENNARHALPKFIQPLALLSVSQCVEFARIALREVAWGKLVAPGRAYVHFGYDYYYTLGFRPSVPRPLLQPTPVVCLSSDSGLRISESALTLRSRGRCAIKQRRAPDLHVGHPKAAGLGWARSGLQEIRHCRIMRL